MSTSQAVIGFTLFSDRQARTTLVVADDEGLPQEVIGFMAECVETDMRYRTLQYVKAVDRLIDRGKEVLQVRFRLDSPFRDHFETDLLSVLEFALAVA